MQQHRLVSITRPSLFDVPCPFMLQRSWTPCERAVFDIAPDGKLPNHNKINTPNNKQTI
jgi:hypothetical protein